MLSLKHMAVKQKHPGGRPTDYNKEIASAICAELAEGRSLRTVCKSDNMPAMSTVFLWLRDHKEFSEQYAQAKEESAEAQHEELADLGDQAIQLAQSLPGQQASAAVQAVRLKADNLKWSMSKMKPKKYGDKLDVDAKVDGQLNINLVSYKDAERSQSDE